MKLGTQTNSLVNNLMARGVVGQPTPFLGMGATLLCWTDRNPATITEIYIKLRKVEIKVTPEMKVDVDYTLADVVRIGLQRDHYKRTDNNGMSECQEYEYSPNPTSTVKYFRINKGGLWEGTYQNPETGRWIKDDTYGLKIGVREKYEDPSF